MVYYQWMQQTGSSFRYFSAYEIASGTKWGIAGGSSVWGLCDSLSQAESRQPVKVVLKSSETYVLSGKKNMSA